MWTKSCVSLKKIASPFIFIFYFKKQKKKKRQNKIETEEDPMGLLSGGRWKVSSFACRLLDFVSFASPLSFFSFS